jgi:hypothetical protein
VFDNHDLDVNARAPIAMGNYYFTCATTGAESKVEYTFGYKRCADGMVRIFLHHSSVPYPAPAGSTLVAARKAAAKPSSDTFKIAPVGSLAPLTQEDVLSAQKAWASAIKSISKACLEKGDFVKVAGDAAGELYGYGHSKVLFKPTKAAQFQFRPTASDAMSYFVGCKAVAEGGYEEDGGFAINGGKGWSEVVFDNHQIQVNDDGTAIAMGNYFFTCSTTGEKNKVEYTFGYKRCADGKVRIFLHHSSVPYSAPKKASLPEGVVSEAEVLEAQARWASAIKSISKAYLERGDYIKVAGDAAGQLYGYGHSNVLFKPTKAAEVQFRPTASDAMSYFVG